jgi:16S rRNA processing protein RimM
MDLIEVGRLGRPHGLDGELGLDLCSLTALELHAVKSFTWKVAQGTNRTLTLVTARPANKRMLVRFAEAASRAAAAALTNGRLYAERERLPDPGPGVAYRFQLIGMEVLTEEGRALGTVADILPSPAHPVLVVRGEKEILVPAVPEFVKAVSVDERRITVKLLPGMEDAG